MRKRVNIKLKLMKNYETIKNKNKKVSSHARNLKLKLMKNYETIKNKNKKASSHAQSACDEASNFYKLMCH